MFSLPKSQKKITFSKYKIKSDFIFNKFIAMEQDYINILWVSVVILVLVVYIVISSCISNRIENFTVDITVVEYELPMYSVEDNERPPAYSLT
jgi:hypothetical protein